MYVFLKKGVNTIFDFIFLVCNNNTYGPGCALNCGNCSNGETCHHINGTCPHGCAEGALGDICHEGVNIHKDCGTKLKKKM